MRYLRYLEPYQDLVGLSFSIGGLDNAVPELQDHINLSLQRADKTREECDAAGRKVQEEYVRSMERTLAADSSWPDGWIDSPDTEEEAQF